MKDNNNVYITKGGIKVQGRPSLLKAARFMMVRQGDEYFLEEGTWLKKVSSPDWYSGFCYRLPGGVIVRVEEELVVGKDVEVLADPQAVLAMQAYKDLDDWMEEKGLELDTVYNDVPPFSVIKCPLCGGTRFISMANSAVWCGQCNAKFSVRYTAGDPGFVVDCTWESYWWGGAKYILPRCSTLVMTMVLKDTGDPRDMDTSDCGCDPENMNLTDGSSSLRPGLHSCNVGTLYDWNLYGSSGGDIKQNSTSLKLDNGEDWREPAGVRRYLDLSYDEKSTVRYARYSLKLLMPHVDDDLTKTSLVNTLEELDAISERGKPGPVIKCFNTLPPMDALKKGEKYMLHHWVTDTDEKAPYREWALPVWWVVQPEIETGRDDRQRYTDNLKVIRNNICITCGNPVTKKNYQARGTANNGLKPHGKECVLAWEKYNWQPEGVRQEKAEEATAPV